MERSIVDFQRDEEGHWVAALSCGHAQHTRHNPPLVWREWVRSEAGRRGRIGTPLLCARCDRREVPEGFAPYRSTPTFTETSIPKGLLKHHSTKPGIWGLIHVGSGALDYICEVPLAGTQHLTPELPGIVVPEVEHRVAAAGAVCFRVEFWRASGG